MQTVPETELIQFENWTLRVRGTTHPAPRLLLLIHGFTGDENSMWVFAPGLPTDYWIVAPRAPYAAELGGYSWRQHQSLDSDWPNFQDLQSEVQALTQLIEAYQRSIGRVADGLDTIGFSQGAALSSLLAFTYPDRIHRLGMLAGFVPVGIETLAASRPLEGKPVFVAHGTKDERVPIEQARHSIQILEQAGAKVTYCEDEVGHKVSVRCLHAMRKFLAA